MKDGWEVWVVVPACDEEAWIEKTLDGMPDLVDRIVVVDDASRDGTAARVRAHPDPRVRLVRRRANGGVGAAIISGYRRFLRDTAPGRRAIAVVMAGDDQMDPRDLPDLLDPIVGSGAEFVKGNRFASPATIRAMPRIRRLGNVALTWLTRLATGNWSLHDSQCGYTAIRREALDLLDLEALYPRYGFPNDLLLALGRAGVLIEEVPVRAVYAGERSGIVPWVVVPRIVLLLARGWLSRITRRPASEVREQAAGSAPSTLEIAG